MVLSLDEWIESIEYAVDPKNMLRTGLYRTYYIHCIYGIYPNRIVSGKCMYSRAY